MSGPFQQIPRPSGLDPQIVKILVAVKHNIDALLGNAGPVRALTTVDLDSGTVLGKKDRVALERATGSAATGALTQADIDSGKVLGAAVKRALDKEIADLSAALAGLSQVRNALTAAMLGHPNGVASLDANSLLVQALKPTGVAAGQYGDSAHITQVVVGADGRVTAAAEIDAPVGAPLAVPDGEAFTIPENRQVLWAVAGSGSLNIQGAFVEAN